VKNNKIIGSNEGSMRASYKTVITEENEVFLVK
jgi:hypothetical protein